MTTQEVLTPIGGKNIIFWGKGGRPQEAGAVLAWNGLIFGDEYVRKAIYILAGQL